MRARVASGDHRQNARQRHLAPGLHALAGLVLVAAPGAEHRTARILRRRGHRAGGGRKQGGESENAIHDRLVLEAPD